MTDFTKGSENVFEDLGFAGEEAVALKIKADLMIEIEKAIAKAKLSQVKAAEALGIARPRLNQMLKGRFQGVTIDKMVEMVGRTGKTVSLKVERRKLRDDARSHVRVAKLHSGHAEETYMAKRDTYKYQFKVGNKIVHGGITDDLERREQEHQQNWSKGHIKQVGNRTTEDAAREWEKKKGYT